MTGARTGATTAATGARTGATTAATGARTGATTAATGATIVEIGADPTEEMRNLLTVSTHV